MADTTPLSSKRKIQRASKPKVKSGCITCKKRRVKCDETKPECLRCKNFGCVCDGYEFPSHKVPLVVPRRPLVPKIQGAVRIQPRKSSNGMWFDQTEGDHCNQAIVFTNGSQKNSSDQFWGKFPYGQMKSNIATDSPSFSSLIYSPSMTIFESEQEVRYFRYYCDTTAQQLSGGHSDSTWNHGFLQAAHEEPFVRRAIIAIAALGKAMEVCQPGLNRVKALPDINEASSRNPHHVFALQQYGKAVRQMRDAIAKGDENIRMALISCLLTVCFESFHGHHENALGQISAGLSIMHDWLKKQHTARCMSGLRSPNPHVMDDKLFHSFVRLDIAAMHFFDKRPAEFHREQSLEGFETVKHMPESFDDLEEAGIYFAVIMKRIMHFVKWVESSAGVHRHSKQARLGATDLESTFPNHHHNIISDSKLNELGNYAGELEHWATAFQPIMNRTRTPEGQMELLPVSFLRLHQKLLFLRLVGLTFHAECLFDQFLPEFTEMVASAETLLSHPSLAHSAGRAVFVFDPDIILPLLVVAIKCRNWVIRRKAIELLRDNPRREGTWDSSLAAAIGFWHMTLEEKGLQTGDFVPESSRVRIAGVKQDFEKRTAHLSASQEVDGKTIIHETVVPW